MEREARLTTALKIVALVAISLVLVAVAITGLKLLGSSGIVILASILITYLITPLVGIFRRRLPLVWSILLTYVVIAVVIGFAFLVIIPPLVAQARSLISGLPSTIATVQSELANPQNPWVQKLPPDIRNYINALPSQFSAIASKYGLGVVQGTLGAFFSIFTLFLSLIIVPIFSAYLFFDSGEMKRALMGFIPSAARPKAIAILSDLNTTIAAFVRGQVLDGLILGAMITIMLWITHVPYALLIGVTAGILNLIPYVGAIIGFIPAVLLALVFNGWQNALIVGVLFGVIQQIDGNVILPRVMKSTVQLSPLIIIASILVFSAFFGIVGTFLAVPVTAMLRVLKMHFAPAPSPLEEIADEKKSRALQVLQS